MFNKPMDPCGAISADERANRLSLQMVVLGDAVKLKHSFADKPRKPGFCVLCGTQLPVAYRAVKCVEPQSEECPNGRFACAEATHEPGSIAKMHEWMARTPADDWGLRDGYFVAPVTSCSCITESVFIAAKQLAYQRNKDLRDHGESQSSTGRARKAAAATAAF